jgi:peptide/nickel transport system permease protein
MQLNASIIPVSGTVGQTSALPGGQVLFSVSKSFEWTTKAPLEFAVATYFSPMKMENLTRIYMNYIVSSPQGNRSLSSTQTYVLDAAVDFGAYKTGRWWWSNVTDSVLGLSQLPGFGSGNISQTVFPTTGTYTLTLQVQGVPKAGSTTSSVSLNIAFISFYEQGNTYGLLGTDNNGRDVWSQLVWGSQVSLMIGILSGVGSVLLGTLAGLAAGYVGGISDEIISRVTDFFLVLPFLPLLITITLVISQNALLVKDLYFWVVVIFIILSWPSIAKIIRSQVLSIKERQYVEASRAVGGGTAHILRRHILPNVMGLVYSQIALNVSGFILLEAALDFLSVSIRPITVTTWGVMLTKALPYATVDAIHQYVWWWFLPPGIAIAMLSLAFVLVGFALDSIFNPRLRAR